MIMVDEFDPNLEMFENLFICFFLKNCQIIKKLSNNQKKLSHNKPTLGMDESYDINVFSPQPNSLISCKHIWGCIRGLETFAQLIDLKYYPKYSLLLFSSKFSILFLNHLIRQKKNNRFYGLFNLNGRNLQRFTK